MLFTECRAAEIKLATMCDIELHSGGPMQIEKTRCAYSASLTGMASPPISPYSIKVSI